MKSAMIYRDGGGVLPDTPSRRRQAPSRSYSPNDPERSYAPRRSYAVDFASERDQYPDNSIFVEGLTVELQRIYDFRDSATVVEFLRDRGSLSLGAVLLEAQERIRDYFGYGTRPALKVVTDPEARNEQHLFVVIRTKLRPKAARTILAELDREWWQGVFLATEGKLTINLEYI